VKEFNNVEMTEEELDNVASGQKCFCLERKSDGGMVLKVSLKNLMTSCDAGRWITRLLQFFLRVA